MKKFCVMTGLLLAVSTLNVAHAEAFYWGQGAEKCSAFNKEAKNTKNTPAYGNYLAWAMGSMSMEESICRTAHKVKGCAGEKLSPVVIMLGVTEYCEHKPNDYFGDAVSASWSLLYHINKGDDKGDDE